MSFKILFVLSVISIAAFAQQPETLKVSAKNPQVVYSRDTLRVGTAYVVTATGGISYWQSDMNPDSADADAGYVYRVPVIPGYSASFRDSVTVSIQWNAGFMYLPCDGSQCTSIPTSLNCGSYENYHSTNVYGTQQYHLDKDYFSVNGEEYCPRNGADMSRHSYVEAIMGTGERAAFQFHDGDGDFVNNSGELALIITRLEPIATPVRRLWDFGRLLPLSATKVFTDSIRSIGSPYFPGCHFFEGLTVQYVAFSGDTGVDGFRVNGLKPGQKLDFSQQQLLGLTYLFSPKQVRTYRAVLSLTTTDPQAGVITITLQGSGSQGILACLDTIDFGTVAAGSVHSLPFMISNAGNADLHLSSFHLSSQDTAFTCSDTSAAVLPAGSVRFDSVMFAPTTLGGMKREVTVTSDGFGTASRTVTLIGTSVPPDRVAASPAPRSFNLDVTVAPNPCFGNGFISFGSVVDRNDVRGVISLFDVLGRRVRVLYDGTLSLANRIDHLDFRGLPSGLYFLSAVLNNGTSGQTHVVVVSPFDSRHD